MSYEIGYDDNWERDIGYGVPSICDHPDCNKEINRGLSYVCGGEAYGGEYGCGLFFCENHLGTKFADNDEDIIMDNICDRCEDSMPPFNKKYDTIEWIQWKYTDESWEDWRAENKEEVKKIAVRLDNEQ